MFEEFKNFAFKGNAFDLSIDDEPERGSVESIVYGRMQMPNIDNDKFWNVWSVMRDKFARKH